MIDSAGHVRQKYGTGAGPGTSATDSSFAVLFADAARQAMGAPDAGHRCPFGKKELSCRTGLPSPIAASDSHAVVTLGRNGSGYATAMLEALRAAYQAVSSWGVVPQLGPGWSRFAP